MPVNALRLFRPTRTSNRCWVHPNRRDWLESLGLRTPNDFLALPGVVVSGHVGRNVSRVELAGTTAFLKREHRVRRRDRFRSWRDGFGWASVSVREAAVLKRLDMYGLPVPSTLAYGEADRQGFLLVEAAIGAADLRSLPAIAADLADRLGWTIARMHAVGVDQADLFAKHILVRPDELTITILDWQRAALRPLVPWPNRVRSLAALRATASTELIPDLLWDRLLASYLKESARTGRIVPTSDRIRRAVDAGAAKLHGRRDIRSQRLIAGSTVSQELVRIGGETVCAIPGVAASLTSESSIAAVYDRANNGRSMPLPGGPGLLRVGRYALPFGRWWAALRGRSWRSPELKAARLLFHLERYGIPAPKLLAYGQVIPRLAPARSFLLSRIPELYPVEPKHAVAVRILLDRLHAVGCRLTTLDALGRPFGFNENGVVVHDVGLVRLTRRLTRRQVERDRARLDAFFRGRR